MRKRARSQALSILRGDLEEAEDGGCAAMRHPAFFSPGHHEFELNLRHFMIFYQLFCSLKKRSMCAFYLETSVPGNRSRIIILIFVLCVFTF